MSDDEPKPGSAEDQGPVTITPELADRLAEKRTELFEEFEIRDEFPNEVLREAETRPRTCTRRSKPRSTSGRISVT